MQILTRLFLESRIKANKRILCFYLQVILHVTTFLFVLKFHNIFIHYF